MTKWAVRPVVHPRLPRDEHVGRTLADPGAEPGMDDSSAYERIDEGRCPARGTESRAHCGALRVVDGGVARGVGVARWRPARAGTPPSRARKMNAPAANSRANTTSAAMTMKARSIAEESPEPAPRLSSSSRRGEAGDPNGFPRFPSGGCADSPTPALQSVAEGLAIGGTCGCSQPRHVPTFSLLFDGSAFSVEGRVYFRERLPRTGAVCGTPTAIPRARSTVVT
jgi:hypothetical protein